MSTFSVLYPRFLMCCNCISIGQLRPRVSHKNEHILKKVILGTLWVMKKEHFHKKVSWGPLWVTRNEHFLKKVSWDPMWVTKNDHVPKKVGAPREWRKMSTFSRRSVRTPCESQKISTFSSYVCFFLCHVLSSLSLCRLGSGHHDFLSGREIDCHLTFAHGFIFSTGIFLLHIKENLF